MELQKIKLPKEWDEPKFSQQELADLSEQSVGRQAMAKDWRLLAQRVDILGPIAIENRDVLVEHDKLLEDWRRTIWLLKLLGWSGSILAFLSILKMFGVF